MCVMINLSVVGDTTASQNMADPRLLSPPHTLRPDNDTLPIYAQLDLPSNYNNNRRDEQDNGDHGNYRIVHLTI